MKKEPTLLYEINFDDDGSYSILSIETINNEKLTIKDLEIVFDQIIKDLKREQRKTQQIIIIMP